MDATQEKGIAMTSERTPAHRTLDSRLGHTVYPFALDDTARLHAAVDQLIAAHGDALQLLALGETLHSGEEILLLRNRLFQYLVEAHGFSAIAVESSFPRSVRINEYVLGHSADGYDTVQDEGFSHGFGQLEANRELVEWMRQYNLDRARTPKVHFYGFDSPTEMMGTDSPRALLHFVLDYLDTVDDHAHTAQRARLDTLLGDEAAWQNPAAMMDPSQAIGQSPAAGALRLETEDLIMTLQRRRPELVATGGRDGFLAALQHAIMARQLLTYHAGLARPSEERTSELLGVRDVMMADNLALTVERERARGKVFAFAHNRHVQRSVATWQLGPQLLAWWPAGAHLSDMLGPGYVLIGTALGVSIENGVDAPEADTLEARLTALPGPVRLLPTLRNAPSPALAAEVAALPLRTGSQRNQSYMPLDANSLTDFDWLVVFDEVSYTRGGPPLPG